jgi:hypothetical protein
MPNLRELNAENIYRLKDIEFFLDETRFPHLTSLRFEFYMNERYEDEFDINGSNTTITKLELVDSLNGFEMVLLPLKGLKHFSIRFLNISSYGLSYLLKPLIEFHRCEHGSIGNNRSSLTRRRKTERNFGVL